MISFTVWMGCRFQKPCTHHNISNQLAHFHCNLFVPITFHSLVHSTSVNHLGVRSEGYRSTSLVPCNPGFRRLRAWSKTITVLVKILLLSHFEIHKMKLILRNFDLVFGAANDKLQIGVWCYEYLRHDLKKIALSLDASNSVIEQDSWIPYNNKQHEKVLFISSTSSFSFLTHLRTPPHRIGICRSKWITSKWLHQESLIWMRIMQEYPSWTHSHHMIADLRCVAFCSEMNLQAWAGIHGHEIVHALAKRSQFFKHIWVPGYSAHWRSHFCFISDTQIFTDNTLNSTLVLAFELL